MQWTPTQLNSTTGASLAYFETMPEAAPKAIVQINHGMAEHAARYARFADDLMAAGYGVVAHDHRGHGNTTAPDAPLGQFSITDGWVVVIDDIRFVHEHLEMKFPNTPRVIFGHSMGSILAFNAVLKHPQLFAAVACWNAGLETGMQTFVYSMLLKIERFFKGSDVPSNFAAKLTFDAWNKEFAPNRTDFDWLSRDDKEVDKYVADPNCGFSVSVGLWLDVLDAVTFGADDNNLHSVPKNLPIHLLGGAADPCSLHGNAIKNIAARLQKQGLGDVTFQILENTRHESLNEINRDQVTTDFIQWLNQRFA